MGEEIIKHPRVDFEHWSKIFPLESFDKPSGRIITSPAHLCEVELVRKKVAESADLGEAVPVDTFLWSVEPPRASYLTKIGGIPHREALKPWPKANGTPLTFVAQFCFIDSRDIVSDRIPNDVMLVFFKDSDSLWDGPSASVQIEWSPLQLDVPLEPKNCPPPAFPRPELSGYIYRTNEYPDSEAIFDDALPYSAGSNYDLPKSQSSKIGRETLFIQEDPRSPDNELICALSSVHPSSYPPGAKWPFIGMETLPEGWDERGEHYGWGRYEMIFGDVGCVYFMIDKDGQVTWDWDCY